jgi:hypothetical protein
VKGDKWTLHRAGDGSRLADLVIYDWDFPWVNAKVEHVDGLDEFRPLFDAEVALLERVDDHVDAWEAAAGAVRAAVSLRYPEGNAVPEFLMHIQGDEAWWRWNDEPFDDEDNDEGAEGDSDSGSP